MLRLNVAPFALDRALAVSLGGGRFLCVPELDQRSAGMNVPVPKTLSKTGGTADGRLNRGKNEVSKTMSVDIAEVPTHSKVEDNSDKATDIAGEISVWCNSGVCLAFKMMLSQEFGPGKKDFDIGFMMATTEAGTGCIRRSALGKKRITVQ